jgi:molybdopterin synthase catalytic subunit
VIELHIYRPPNVQVSNLEYCFIGTTRDSFENRPVASLAYSSYVPKALQTLIEIARQIQQKHNLVAIAVEHRLGTVAIGETSILIAVSAPHRQAAWRAGEEALELCKERAEIWKKEEFEDGDSEWRANKPDVAPGKS